MGINDYDKFNPNTMTAERFCDDFESQTTMSKASSTVLPTLFANAMPNEGAKMYIKNMIKAQPTITYYPSALFPINMCIKGRFIEKYTPHNQKMSEQHRLEKMICPNISFYNDWADQYLAQLYKLQRDPTESSVLTACFFRMPREIKFRINDIIVNNGHKDVESMFNHVEHLLEYGRTIFESFKQMNPNISAANYNPDYIANSNWTGRGYKQNRSTNIKNENNTSNTDDDNSSSSNNSNNSSDNRKRKSSQSPNREDKTTTAKRPYTRHSVAQIDDSEIKSEEYIPFLDTEKDTSSQENDSHQMNKLSMQSSSIPFNNNTSKATNTGQKAAHANYKNNNNNTSNNNKNFNNNNTNNNSWSNQNKSQSNRNNNNYK